MKHLRITVAFLMAGNLRVILVSIGQKDKNYFLPMFMFANMVAHNCEKTNLLSGGIPCPPPYAPEPRYAA